MSLAKSGIREVSLTGVVVWEGYILELQCHTDDFLTSNTIIETIFIGIGPLIDDNICISEPICDSYICTGICMSFAQYKVQKTKYKGEEEFFHKRREELTTL